MTGVALKRWVLAIDPGEEHTGWAQWRRRWGRVDAGEEDTGTDHDFMVWLTRELAGLANAEGVAAGLVVIEEFRLYGGKTLGSQVWRQMKTSELVGAIKWQCWTAGVDVVEQGASIKNPTRAQMKARGIGWAGHGSHAHDAEMHLWHWLLKNGVETC